MQTSSGRMLALAFLAALTAQARSTTRSASDYAVRGLDVINPGNWTSLSYVPADVLDKAVFVSTGGGSGGRDTDVIVHTEDNRTYVYTGAYGKGEKTELRGLRMKDAQMSMIPSSDWIFFVLLTDRGDVYTAGYNRHKQLGYPTPGIRSPEFKKVPGLSGVTQIAVGGQFTMALTQDKQVYFWGEIFNWAGDSPAASQTPVRVNFPREDFVPGQLAAGWGHCMVLSENGRIVMGFGMNDDNKLGLGDESPGRSVNMDRPQAALFPAGVQLRSLHCGLDTGFALDVDGRLWQWGSDDYGALGQGGETNQPVPTTDMPTMKTRRVSSLRVWRSAAVAVTTDDEVYIWGAYSFRLGPRRYATLVEDASHTPCDMLAKANMPVGTAGAVTLDKTGHGSVGVITDRT